jgi:hypothetical protein
MRIGGTLYYTVTDQLGSASVVTDNSGAVVGEQRYYPYGEARVPSGNMQTDRLYTGQRQMASLGNIYDYGAGFYLAQLHECRVGCTGAYHQSPRELSKARLGLQESCLRQRDQTRNDDYGWKG